MTDVYFHNTEDGGDISMTNDIIDMNAGLETSVYLSLFGGNEDDPGGADESKAWWGNALETDPSKKYRSETQYLLRSIPAVSANLVRIAGAVNRDLAPLVEAGVLVEPEVSVGIPRLNWVGIRIATEVGELVFMEPWEV